MPPVVVFDIEISWRLIKCSMNLVLSLTWTLLNLLIAQELKIALTHICFVETHLCGNIFTYQKAIWSVKTVKSARCKCSQWYIYGLGSQILNWKMTKVLLYGFRDRRLWIWFPGLASYALFSYSFTLFKRFVLTTHFKSNKNKVLMYFSSFMEQIHFLQQINGLCQVHTARF